jgi:integrase
MSAGTYRSWLAPYFRGFIRLKAALGIRYRTERRLLGQFDRYLIAHAPRPPLRCATLAAYSTSFGAILERSRDNLIRIAWMAVAYAQRHGAAIEAIPPRPPPAPRGLRQREPRILSTAEMLAILAAARSLPPTGCLRAATCSTLTGLLYTTGMRIGEALALDVADLDKRNRLITVRDGKFGKTRVLPLRPSTVAALGRYLRHPRRKVRTSPSAPFFVSSHRVRLFSTTFLHSFRQACLAAGIREPRPRVHDLRHTFAVERVVQCWRSPGSAGI